MPDRYRGAITVSWDGPVVDVVLNRPEKFNALNREVLDGLLAVQDDVRARPEVRVLKLSGAGKVFCAGADLEYIRGIYTDAAASRSYLYALRDAIIGMERLPIPVVTAVHGVVLAGGLELMLGCDIVVAAESTRIGDQHMNYGFIPGGGSTQRLPRHVGPARARDLLFTGRWLSAQDAWHMGLVSRVVPDAQLSTATSELADELATRSRHAMSRTKDLVRRADDAGFSDGLDLEIESVLGFYNAPEFAASLEAFRTRKSAGS